MRIFGRDTSEPVPMTWGRLLGLAGMMSALAGALLDTTNEHWLPSAIGLVLVCIGVVLIGIRLVSYVNGNDVASTTKTPNGK